MGFSLLPPWPWLSLKPIQLCSTDPMDMELTHMPMVPTLHMATVPIPHTDTMERDLLMLNQRLMLLSSMEPTVDTDLMDTHTPMDTTERDLLMLSQRLRLT